MARITKNGNSWNFWKIDPTPMPCVSCGVEFIAKYKGAKYCSKNCNQRFYSRTRTALAAEIKMQRGCIDCGYKGHPAALEFDHVRGAKKHTISRIKSIPEMLKEIEKCDVRCSNCHRIRTWEFQSMKTRKNPDDHVKSQATRLLELHS